MPESIVEQIVTELRSTSASLYPQHTELRNVRVVGHTPKPDHYIYDIVVDFSDGSERIAAKVYRSAKCGSHTARNMAQKENDNLSQVYDIFSRRQLTGVPRPLGNFSEHGAVVAEKLNGVPLQSIIMKAALLPGYADHGTLHAAARETGDWLRKFHKATADMPSPFDGHAFLAELEKLCANCKGSGLDDASVRTIIDGAKSILNKGKKAVPTSAVLNDFCPLNVVLGEQGVGFCDFANMSQRGVSYHDVALFLASVEALEKYPFCNRAITAEVQDSFLEAYGASPAEEQILRVLKMKALLAMFANGRNNVAKESAVRKKVMWATVMKRFIQQAAERSMAPAA